MNMHAGCRQFICETCDKNFTCASNLRTHERVHTSERKFICNQISRCIIILIKFAVQLMHGDHAKAE